MVIPNADTTVLTDVLAVGYFGHGMVWPICHQSAQMMRTQRLQRLTIQYPLC
jgi:hypothetical protein